MSLGNEQREFSKFLVILISYIYSCGYAVSLGDAWASDDGIRHIKGTFHAKRLAIDLNLFKEDIYLQATEDHKPFGEFWESLHPKCTWGGRFRRKDGNHYSWGERR